MASRARRCCSRFSARSRSSNRVCACTPRSSRKRSRPLLRTPNAGRGSGGSAAAGTAASGPGRGGGRFAAAGTSSVRLVVGAKVSRPPHRVGSGVSPSPCTWASYQKRESVRVLASLPGPGGGSEFASCVRVHVSFQQETVAPAAADPWRWLRERWIRRRGRDRFRPRPRRRRVRQAPPPRAQAWCGSSRARRCRAHRTAWIWRPPRARARGPRTNRRSPRVCPRPPQALVGVRSSHRVCACTPHSSRKRSRPLLRPFLTPA